MAVLNLTLAYYYTNPPSVLFCSVQCQCQPTNSSNLCSLTNTLKAACRSYSTTHYIKCVFFGSSTAAASICNACHPFFKETSLYTPMIRLRITEPCEKCNKNEKELQCEMKLEFQYWGVALQSTKIAHVVLGFMEQKNLQRLKWKIKLEI